MNCKHCTHSSTVLACAKREAALVLMCRLHKRPCGNPCADFEREPGSDDE